MNIIDNILINIACTIGAVIELFRYLLHKPRPKDTPWPRLIICRARGHKAGVVWYNMNSMEPDMHCRNCGDDLC
jgi:hypothetical protein